MTSRRGARWTVAALAVVGLAAAGVGVATASGGDGSGTPTPAVWAAAPAAPVQAPYRAQDWGPDPDDLGCRTGQQETLGPGTIGDGGSVGERTPGEVLGRGERTVLHFLSQQRPTEQFAAVSKQLRGGREVWRVRVFGADGTALGQATTRRLREGSWVAHRIAFCRAPNPSNGPSPDRAPQDMTEQPP